ncbi:DinB superfamily protein [Botrimarina colliarenosi]|uniref:DinB superfamily protein n=1 Tax=Botrimarina colliarenosi TaxID=2528001 RepID=A0A5C6AFZ6_9BACT|nr:DinB family protein [Botrimarina colliarenosi]TWT98115.1 DinB superfamily protein [Botrimarina colliarenosi]
MITPDDLLFSYRWGADTFAKLVSDVADADFAAQPVEGINHPAWLFGHIATYHDVIGQLLRGEAFDNPWDSPCGKNSFPGADRSAYPSKEAILARHEAGVAAAVEAIAASTPDAWSRPLEHPTWGKQFATVAPAVVFLATTHQGLHLGQLSGWRRAMGLPRI